MSLQVREGNKTPICYLSSRYRSHARAANDYCDLLSADYSVSEQLDSKIVILHVEPHNYRALFDKYPQLKDKYVIAFCVWEATSLPETYRDSLQLVQEVWTCSKYCVNIIKKDHPNVIYVPHLVKRSLAFSSNDMDKTKAIVRYDARCHYFLHITKMWDKRKNTPALIQLVSSLRSRIPNARLIIKDIQGKQERIYHDTNICYIGSHLSDEELNALYTLSCGYISPHHSEGWGFTMSDAALFRRPVIATGYSGNLEYLDEQNSLLIAYHERNIDSGDEYELFNSSMSWAYPDIEDLANKLVWLYDNLDQPSVREMINRAAESAARFNSSLITEIMRTRLQAILH
jgi:glycosyltransferase involved in cell wall biosynthesis